MVKINYCPICGGQLKESSLICPSCGSNIEEVFNDGNEVEIVDASEIDLSSADEIVIVVPEDADSDEIVIDLDALGIDVESLDDNVNIVIQVEGEDLDEDFFDEDDEELEPNEWYFDDDPYGIVYYEFPDFDED